MNIEIRKIMDSWQPGHALPRAVYHDPEIYDSEIRRIFLKTWQYVGHVSQIPEKGDYFLFEIAGESVILVRDGDGGVNALLNVCRHRGSRICDDASGHESRFICKYHGWTYGLDGSLRALGFPPEGIDKSKLGLKRLQAKVFEGMIFINFDPDAVPFDVIERDLGPLLSPWDLGHAKIAHRRNYPIESNWKLTVENYCECYHCLPAHPEYSVGHGLAMPRKESEALREEVMCRAESVGLSRADTRHSWLAAGALGTDRDFERTRFCAAT
jgi:Rieske 2Fe-2S family protein